MKKYITFCKSYLTEILFVLLTILLIGGFIICWRQFDGWAVGICGAMAMLIEMCIAVLLSRDCRSFKITHYVCFVLLAVVFVTGIVLSADSNKGISIIFVLAIVAFCSLFSDFAAVTYFSKEEITSMDEDNCDDD